MEWVLSKEDQLFKKSIFEFSKNELNDSVMENDEKGQFAFKNWKKCAKMDLLSLLCPKKYGGCEENLTSALLSIESLSQACKDSGLVHSIVTQLCCITQILLFGTEDQKQTTLPDLISGKKIAAQAITEPDAGSDLSALQSIAEKIDGTFILNGSKTFISNAPVADIFIVFAVTNPTQKKFGGISCFIVDKENQGLKIGSPLNKMGLRTLQNGELFFDNCRLTSMDLLGEIGQGMIIFNEVIDWERLLMAAAHIGTMQRILDNCIAHAKSRVQFGQPISQFQSVSHKLADMKVNIELGKAMLAKASHLKTIDHRITLEASIVKLFISESLKNACLQAVQIYGGYGYMKEFEIERDLRDSIASTIYSGTSEIQKNIISSLIGVSA